MNKQCSKKKEKQDWKIKSKLKIPFYCSFHMALFNWSVSLASAVSWTYWRFSPVVKLFLILLSFRFLICAATYINFFLIPISPGYEFESSFKKNLNLLLFLKYYYNKFYYRINLILLNIKLFNSVILIKKYILISNILDKNYPITIRMRVNV